jgi:hypothetical protein
LPSRIRSTGVEITRGIAELGPLDHRPDDLDGVFLRHRPDADGEGSGAFLAARWIAALSGLKFMLPAFPCFLQAPFLQADLRLTAHAQARWRGQPCG